jgi:hypothetical protein
VLRGCATYALASFISACLHSLPYSPRASAVTMDPLSITASIAGLLGISGKIYSILSEFVSNVKDAPRSVQTAMFAVEEMRLALISVEKLILDVPSVPRKRKALVEVDHLVITLTESVITFSDLEALVSPFVTDSVIDTSAWKRLKWAWKEEKVSLSIQRLESHKSSIIMMLSILQWQVYHVPIGSSSAFANIYLANRTKKHKLLKIHFSL